MAIDKSLQEPDLELRSCYRCGKRGADAKLAGTLIHFPHEDCQLPPPLKGRGLKTPESLSG